MKILWVKVGGLFPLTTGGRLRSHHLISELSRRHRLTVITTHRHADEPTALAESLPRCEVVSFPHTSPDRNSWRLPLTLIRSWATPLPVDLFKFQVPAVQREVALRMRSDRIDLCVADFLHAMPNVAPAAPRVPVILFAHNVEFMIWKRMTEVTPSPLRRAVLELEWRKLRRYEGRACASADLTVAVSNIDAGVLRENSPLAETCAIPTGVDTEYFTPTAGNEVPNSMVFTGSMDWHPNEDGIGFFVDDILPRIRAEIPDASLVAVGRSPTARLRERAARAHVRLTGTVPDVRPYVAASSVYVVPLRIGSGTRLKIFEALAMGKAVVSTTVGAEGLPLVPGEHYLRADDPQSFAAAVLALLRDPLRRQMLGSAGRKLMEERFAWSMVAAEFEKHCDAAVKRYNDRSRRAPIGGALPH